MAALEKLRQVLSPSILAADLLIPELTVIPPGGATSEEISELESHLPGPLSPIHRELVTSWNGLNLDVICILGVTTNPDGIPAILALQDGVPAGSGSIAFATDPSGFLYFESADGQVWSLDHDGGETAVLSHNIDHFINEYVFGSEGDRFLGRDWLVQLRQLGLCGNGA